MDQEIAARVAPVSGAGGGTWHWLRPPFGKPFISEWSFGMWLTFGSAETWTPEAAAALGYSYVRPVSDAEA